MTRTALFILILANFAHGEVLQRSKSSVTFGDPKSEPDPVATTTATAAAPQLGTPKFGALLQTWGVSDQTRDNKLNFVLRRAEIKASGSLLDSADYFVMADVAKAIKPDKDARILQDLGIGVRVAPGLSITMGQFKTPSMAEIMLSSSKLSLPERSIVAATLGGDREPGLMVSYEASKSLTASAMISNGRGVNNDSVKTTKDLSLRIDAKPVKDVGLGAFTVLGDLQYSQKGRWGVNANYTIGDTSLGAEYVMGRTDGKTSLGATFEVGHFVTKIFQPVARYEILKPNVNSRSNSSQASLGVNYFLANRAAKIQAAFSSLHNLLGNGGRPTLQVGKNGAEFIVAFQGSI